LFYPPISSQSPTLSAFIRKLDTKDHASERLFYLIIFPTAGSHLIRIFTLNKIKFYHDHAFVLFLIISG